MKLLVLGPRHHKSGQITGGAVVLFELFLKELDKNDIEYKVIDTNKRNYKHALIAPILIFFRFIICLYKYRQIMLHGKDNDYKYMVPVIIFFSNIFGKKVALRKFGGKFHTIYENSHYLIQKMVKYSLKNASSSFFETKYLVDYFKAFNTNTYWFPNVREKTILEKSSAYQKKFIFIGQIKHTKGVLELLNASNKLNDSFTLDFYGPMCESLEDNFANSKAEYKGMLQADEVTDVLLKYDVLVLPSYGEGYPGVIIEAFSVGLPVIATNLDGIKEIVENNQNGILIQPRNVDALVNAMQSFDKNNYPGFSHCALKSFKNFDSEKITKKVLNMIENQLNE